MTQKEEELTYRLRQIGKRIIEHGRGAALKGICVDDNPWKGFSHEYYIWQNGWIFETNLKNKNLKE